MTREAQHTTMLGVGCHIKQHKFNSRDNQITWYLLYICLAKFKALEVVFEQQVSIALIDAIYSEFVVPEHIFNAKQKIGF